MTKTRREFTPEFKRDAVALLESSGRPRMQIATELGISPSMLRNWRAIAHGAAPRSRAARWQRPGPGLIHHNDSQYAAEAYVRHLAVWKPRHR